MARLSERPKVPGDNSPVILRDPWLRHLWALRGTYAGTLIDFEARRAELERLMYGSDLVQPSKDP